MSERQPQLVVSACLAGKKCRYDGTSKTNPDVKKLADDNFALPYCPERTGGLSTPRDPAERVGDRVVTKQGEDVTEAFELGAQRMLKLCQMLGVATVVLTERSPSCGSCSIYDGTFTGNIIPGKGVTAELLEENNIRVISSDDEDEIKETYERLADG